MPRAVGVLLYSPRSYSPRRADLGFKVDAKLFAVEELVELKLGSG